jgi:N-acetylmuramoyl-L-alanine amidase CwlA
METLNIQKQYLDPSPYNRPQVPMQKIEALVIHYIGNANTSAMANRNYFNNLPKINAAVTARNNTPTVIRRKEQLTYASAHYLIGLEGEILAVIPETEIAYTAGGLTYSHLAHTLFFDKKRDVIYPHDKCLNIEVCHPDSSGIFNQASIDSLIELSADIVNRHHLSRDRILRHYDVTGKLCPKYYVAHSDEWEQIVDAIMSEAVCRTGA